MALLVPDQNDPPVPPSFSLTTSSTNPPPPPPTTSTGDMNVSTHELSNPCPNPLIFPSPVNFAAPLQFPSSKFPRGRHLVGDRVEYDINVRLKGECQPQLEVTPITKYISDPGLVLGRQIAVNRTYICYGLKMGNIRVLNINTALRLLLKGHTQRVSDMAFFADDVHLLASASVDGRVFIWKINEGQDDEKKPQITGKVVIALQIVGAGEAIHPCVCWHCHKQEILVVAIGNHILKIDTMKVGKGRRFSAQEPLKCPVDKLIGGIQFVGKHDGEVTELSMCQWMTTHLASASADGTLRSMQKEMEKQMNSMVSGALSKEGRRLEASLGRSLEKVVKANNDALWAHFQEENAKHEKLELACKQQITHMITSFVNKDLPAMLEKTIKKEIAAIGPAIARIINPVLEKAISSAILESFQKGLGEKAVNQLEKLVNTKLEATLVRQIQTQFQTSGKHVLLDALRSSFEATVIPAFETACKAMFEQVDTALQNGFSKCTNAAKRQFEAAHSPLPLAIKDAINSASLITKTLSGELADGQHKLLAMAAAGANPEAVNPLVRQLSNEPLAYEMAEAPFYPTKELSRLLSEGKYEEAFTIALQRSDVFVVSWLCSQVDLQGIFSVVPLPLSQGVLLALLQQLACDISKEMLRKLEWMTHVAVAINPTDTMIAMHVRPIFEQVYQILGHQLTLPSTQAAEASSIRLLMHLVNSVLTTCK